MYETKSTKQNQPSRMIYSKDEGESGKSVKTLTSPKLFWLDDWIRQSHLQNGTGCGQLKVSSGE